MSYILLVDDERDILDIVSLNISISTDTPVKTALSGNQAIKLMETYGEPTLVISDYKMPDGDGLFLYQEIKKKFPNIYFVICSGNPIDEIKGKFPDVFDYLTKPNFIKPLTEIILRSTKSSEAVSQPAAPVKPTYVKVPVSFLLRMGILEFNALIKLSESKYVKIHSKGDLFDHTDADNLHLKALDYLYVSSDDVKKFTAKFEGYLSKKSVAIQSPTSSYEASYDVLETTLAYARALGWGDSIVQTARHAVDLATRMMKDEIDWQKVLKKSQTGDLFGHHNSLLGLVACVVVQGLGWTNEATQQKLVMAALLHDYFLEDADYDLMYQGGDYLRLLREKKHYKDHPVKAAEMARKLKSLPSDVDSIIIQHEERPDGSGFPRGLDAKHISPLSALFIICEELVIFTHNKSITKDTIHAFWEANPLFKEKEPFKKIFKSMIERSA